MLDFVSALQDEILLLARFFLGFMFVVHGKPKMLGAKPILGFSNYLRKQSVPLPVFGAFLAAITELFGGIAMMVGIYTGITAALMAGVMLVAIAVHVKNKDDFKNGWETALLALGLSLVILVTGPGAYSLDALF